MTVEEVAWSDSRNRGYDEAVGVVRGEVDMRWQ